MKGVSELVLLVGVLTAAWTRTPLGAVAHNMVAWASDAPQVGVLERFQTAVPERITATLQEALSPVHLQIQLKNAAQFSPAARMAVQAHLGADALTEVDALLNLDPDFALALERRSIEEEQRLRAISRSRASGSAFPERYQNYRRFLPQKVARKADREVGEVLALATALNLSWPVDPTARITSPFGERHHPVLKKRRFHNGIDVSVPIGTPIHAMGDGTIKHAHENGVSGKYVVIDHGHGVTSSYCHGSAHQVDKFDPVQGGDPILLSGNSGRSTGPHLHFTVKIGRKAIDPMPFFPVQEKEQARVVSD